MAADLTGAAWRKSSLSGSSGGECVEVAVVNAPESGTGPLHVIRDSKDPGGPKLFLSRAGWNAFVGGVKRGEFDL
ncbi:DUF397 domain-containing protein [Streptosporangium sandarakinum]|uniref:DUF397 domain-containing protein n=1 Tax=Streptosporangium sandarakinum TaxID=1260955 RepID=A0A852UYN4_9ACTN|nr:DUF397 domain-containing protein [Streptosporangium sandarakinum]NYF38921.1 hypothetical protein [Streptosporangium sandarakinum]